MKTDTCKPGLITEVTFEISNMIKTAQHLQEKYFMYHHDVL